MPYKIVAKDPRCTAAKPVGLVNANTGELVACHFDEARANQHMKALMANVPDAVNRPTPPTTGRP